MFKKFAEELDTVADTWPAHRSVDLPPRNGRLHHPYRALADTVRQTIEHESTDPRVRQLASSTGVAHGINVTMRYNSHAVESAAEQGIDLAHATDFLYTPDGSAPLLHIAHNPNFVAKKAESHLCILQDSACTLEKPLSDIYVWSGGALQHPDLDATITRARDVLNAEGLLDPQAACRAEKSHQLARIAHALVTICARDERLFETTYSESLHRTADR